WGSCTRKTLGSRRRAASPAGPRSLRGARRPRCAAPAGAARARGTSGPGRPGAGRGGRRRTPTKGRGRERTGAAASRAGRSLGRLLRGVAFDVLDLAGPRRLQSLARGDFDDPRRCGGEDELGFQPAVLLVELGIELLAGLAGVSDPNGLHLDRGPGAKPAPAP